MAIIGVYCEVCGAEVPPFSRVYDPEESRFYCASCFCESGLIADDAEAQDAAPIDYRIPPVTAGRLATGTTRYYSSRNRRRADRTRQAEQTRFLTTTNKGSSVRIPELAIVS